MGVSSSLKALDPIPQDVSLLGLNSGVREWGGGSKPKMGRVQEPQPGGSLKGAKLAALYLQIIPLGTAINGNMLGGQVRLD